MYLLDFFIVCAEEALFPQQLLTCIGITLLNTSELP